MRARYLLPLIAVIGLSGCANWSTLYRQPNFSNSDSLLTDIGARAIYVRPNEKTSGVNENLRNTPKTIVCAEPSPDSMQAYAAKLNWKLLSDATVTREAALAYNTAASYVGNRTQTVQLLRDQLYRLCEAYANGIIDSDTYTMLMSRSQRYTLALAMIDSSPIPGNAASISPENPGEGNPQPNAADRPATITNNNVSRSENYLGSVMTLVGAGDEAYVCINFLKQKNTPAKPTAMLSKVEQYCSELFDEKIKQLTLQNSANVENVTTAKNAETSSTSTDTPNRTPPLHNDTRVLRQQIPIQIIPQL